METMSPPNAASSSALPLLLARYVRGQIAEPAWHNLMHVFDAEDLTVPERLALAKFVNDLLVEQGRIFQMPRPEEIRDLLAETRTG
ncbi:hypothetical protein GQ464_008030 [Rhodocaloribacter litoris]|uniref:hypothetical protein n=1 Tax=Rhodocaloribacter litoris TaxID=2558931 RepID=UPI001E369769|nr:hypothetical protein [Rhodocaloribacter litoris]QXD16875.1 hypothetical protein GQ464_008030 [Rhodocaloribacter litoris]